MLCHSLDGVAQDGQLILVGFVCSINEGHASCLALAMPLDSQKRLSFSQKNSSVGHGIVSGVESSSWTKETTYGRRTQAYLHRGRL